jgi:kynurenine formamidase
VESRERSRRWPPPYEVGPDGKVVGYWNPRPNNWGRFGPDDERGTANYICPEAVRSAAQGVRAGRVFSLSLPLDNRGPIFPGRAGIQHATTVSGTDAIVGTPMEKVFPGVQVTDDSISMPLQASTQWDGLCHVFEDDVMYNGFWGGLVTAVAGARRLGIQHLAASLVGRGVLVDVARYRERPWLEPGERISVAELEAALAAQGVELRRGDLLCLRTGYIERWFRERDPQRFWSGQPGVGVEAAEWAARREIAALAADNVTVEVMPWDDPRQALPFHARAIRDFGLILGEMWWLADLAADCAADGVWEFLLVAPPLKITGGCGSPVNPIAIK